MNSAAPGSKYRRIPPLLIAAVIPCRIFITGYQKFPSSFIPELRCLHGSLRCLADQSRGHCKGLCVRRLPAPLITSRNLVYRFGSGSLFLTSVLSWHRETGVFSVRKVGGGHVTAAVVLISIFKNMRPQAAIKAACSRSPLDFVLLARLTRLR